MSAHINCPYSSIVIVFVENNCNAIKYPISPRLTIASPITLASIHINFWEGFISPYIFCTDNESTRKFGIYYKNPVIHFETKPIKARKSPCYIVEKSPKALIGIANPIAPKNIADKNSSRGPSWWQNLSPTNGKGANIIPAQNMPKRYVVPE